MKKIGLLLVFVVLSFNVSAQDKGHGGDACDQRIDSIRKDVATWITEGGFSGLDLNMKEFSHQEYKERMLEVLNDTKVTAVCVKPQDKILNEGDIRASLYSLSIDGKPKTCVGYTSTDKKPFIICDFDRFYKDTDNADQYWLIHHEFAGIAELEVNDGASSDYSISNQVTEYLAQNFDLKLSVLKPGKNKESDLLRVNFSNKKLTSSRISYSASNSVMSDPLFTAREITKSYYGEESLQDSFIVKRDVENIEQIHQVKCSKRDSGWSWGRYKVKLNCAPTKYNRNNYEQLRIKIFYQVSIHGWDNSKTEKGKGFDIIYEVKQSKIRILSK